VAIYRFVNKGLKYIFFSTLPHFAPLFYITVDNFLGLKYWKTEEAYNMRDMQFLLSLYKPAVNSYKIFTGSGAILYRD
jgi:hypothetical protein